MIKVYLNRKVSETQITIGNQYESGVNAIAFDLSELKEKWPNGNIYLLVSRKAHTWPYSIDDGEFKIEYVLTWKRGFYQMNVVVTDEKITDQLESSNTIFVSDTINAYVNENQINAKALNEQELPRELQIVYDDLITLKKNIEKDLADGKYIGPQGPKGEPGDVTEEYRNLASQIAQNASDAQASAKNAQVSATNAQKALDDTKDFVNQTKTELNQIKTDTRALKDEANTSAVNAQASATSAQESATNASQSATSAQTSATNAQKILDDTKTFANQTISEVNQIKTDTSALKDEANASATSAQKALDDTKDFVNQAKTELNQIKTDTSTLKDEANTSAVNAKSSEDKAKEYADNLKESTDAISQNTKAISELADKKITKFYASNQGETHITDSDNGKIQDLKIYGQSKQDGEPSPSNPVEIKNVVNPKISVLGSNILQKDAINIGQNLFKGNITLNDDDSLSYEGSILNEYATIYIGNFSLKKGTYQLLANQYSSPNDIGTKLIIQKESGNVYILNNNPFIIDADDTKCRLFISTEAGASYPLQVSGTVRCALVYSGSTTDIQPYIEKSVTLPITLNAIPVSSGGNVTVNGQQYIADYVDVEKGKLHRKVKRLNLKDVNSSDISHGFHSNGNGYLSINILNGNANGIAISNQYKNSKWTMNSGYTYMPNNKAIVFVDDRFTDKQTAIGLIKDTYVIYELKAQVEEDLTSEQVEALKMLSTYYPVTNISVNSEQLDGYTVFNYPISLANGWNYVKKQLNDNRDYIYDMDIQSAEAYVNSEYAVTLTELEV